MIKRIVTTQNLITAEQQFLKQSLPSSTKWHNSRFM